MPAFAPADRCHVWPPSRQARLANAQPIAAGALATFYTSGCSRGSSRAMSGREATLAAAHCYPVLRGHPAPTRQLARTRRPHPLHARWSGKSHVLPVILRTTDIHADLAFSSPEVLPVSGRRRAAHRQIRTVARHQVAPWEYLEMQAR